jgi:hypothetical protein
LRAEPRPAGFGIRRAAGKNAATVLRKRRNDHNAHRDCSGTPANGWRRARVEKAEMFNGAASRFDRLDL